MSSFVGVFLCAFLQGLSSMPSFAGLNLYALLQAFYRALFSLDIYRKLSRMDEFHELFRGAFREHSCAPTSSLLYFCSGSFCALVQPDSMRALFRMINFSARSREGYFGALFRRGFFHALFRRASSVCTFPGLFGRVLSQGHLP